jgi:translation initiation factor IF-3
MRQMGQNRGQVEEGPRVNSQIRALEVRLIGAEGEQVGVISTREAQAKAEEAGLDLVEVSPDAKPPVCKLIDYGKYKYQMSKKAHEAKKKQVVVEVKEVNLTPNTDKHDLETKQNHIKRWASEKHRVKIFVKFRGRELSHMELGYRVLEDLMKGLEDVVALEAKPKLEGRRLVANLIPKSDKH